MEELSATIITLTTKYWPGFIVAGVILIGKGFFKQLLVDLNKRIGKPLIEKYVAILASIVLREKEQYRKLCRKLVRDYYIGGLKDYTPHKDIENVYINLKCGSVDKDYLVYSSLINRDDALPVKNRVELHSFINNSNNGVVMLLGGPGSGKTTAVNHILETLISNHRDITPIPIIVREIEKYTDKLLSGIDLLSLTEIFFKERVCRNDDKFPNKWLSRRLESGKCLILIDGIDEIQSTKNKRHILNWIKAEIRRNRESQANHRLKPVA